MPADAAPGFLLLPELPTTGATLVLPEDESHYVLRVCRARPGERLSGTDGCGGLAALRVLTSGPRVSVAVEESDRQSPTRLAWVLAGAPEGERGDWLVEKLAELGVAVFQPVDCERARWEGKQERLERWRRLAVAALRQSRRRFLLEARPRLGLEEALDMVPGDATRWLADTEGVPAAKLLPPPVGMAVGLIGPAAGLTPGEQDLARDHHFRPICLSDGRLRAETAALIWAGWWSGGAPAGAGDRGSPAGLDASDHRP